MKRKVREIEETIARFEADAERYQKASAEKSRVAEMWRRYLRRMTGEGKTGGTPVQLQTANQEVTS